jgi:hypothetical protein
VPKENQDQEADINVNKVKNATPSFITQKQPSHHSTTFTSALASTNVQMSKPSSFTGE